MCWCYVRAAKQVAGRVGCADQQRVHHHEQRRGEAGEGGGGGGGEGGGAQEEGQQRGGLLGLPGQQETTFIHDR